MVCVGDYESLAHAEVFKDISEYLVGSDLTSRYFCKGIYGLAEIFAEEVSAKLHLEALDDALDTVVGTK